MEFKLKLAEVLNVNQSLKVIIEEEKIDALVKFKLLGVMKSIEPLIQNFEIIRNEKINEYGKETGDGRVMIPMDDKEALEKFNADIKKLVGEEVTVNIEKFKPDEILNCGIKSDSLMGLLPIIEQ